MAGLIAHEWFAQAGGSENVVEEFVEALPDADLFVLWNDRGPEIAGRVYESWMASTALRHHKALALPFMPLTWRAVRAHWPYEWALVSSHLFAHHLRLRGGMDGIPKLVYAHTPARYIWAPDHDERGAGVLPRLASVALKPLDRRRSGEAASIAANSHFTRKRIEDCWGRQARVIYPPVNVEQIQARGDWSQHLSDADRATFGGLPRDFLLGASRFVPYKRLDLVIRAGEIGGMPVVLAGEGPAGAELREQAMRADIPVHFIGRPSNELLYALYQRAHAYVFPAIEDFGIMPVEAMALGTPVIVPDRGGAAESAGRLRGGACIPDFSPDSVRSALELLESIDREGLPARCGEFSRRRFRESIVGWLEDETA